MTVRIVILALFVWTGLSAQQTSAPAKQGSNAQLVGERDRIKEDQVAKLFETIRASAQIEHLTRIAHRDSLEQGVCTIAQSGTPIKYNSTNMQAFYNTAEPQSISAELNKVALFNQLHPKNNFGVSRYSVAVWRVNGSQTGETTYWVGVELYGSAVAEFFDYHFTDDMYYRNEWKKTIEPQCRGK
jgi:hypothetical protein